MKMKVAYLRVSSDEQREKQTIKTQRVEVEKFCAAQKVKLDKFYQDDGVSGTIPLGKRLYGSAIMRDAAAGLIGEIYVLKFDRLGRGTRHFLNAVHRLGQLGVVVRSIMQPLPDGASGTMMMQMWAVIAEWDRNNILATTRAGLQRKAAAGGWTGGLVPFGYRVEGKERDARLVKHEIYADLVHRLFERRAKGESCQVLADYLDARGVPTSRQNPGSVWRSNSVRIIITNPVYTGKRQYGRRQWIKVEDEAGDETRHLKLTPERVIEAKVPVIVDQDLWDRANAMLHRDQLAVMAQAKQNYLLKGLITCGLCGLKFTGCGANYSCGGRNRARQLYGKNGKRCEAPIIRRDGLEAAVWEPIAVFRTKPGAAKVLYELEQQMGGKDRSAADEIAELELLLKNEEAKKDRAVTLFTEGTITRDKLNEQLQRINARIAEAEKRHVELRKLDSEAKIDVIKLGQARATLEALRETDEDPPFEKKRSLVVDLVGGVTITPVEGQDPDIRVQYTFLPHHERYNRQWDGKVLGASSARSSRGASRRAGAAGRAAE